MLIAKNGYQHFSEVVTIKSLTDSEIKFSFLFRKVISDVDVDDGVLCFESFTLHSLTSIKLWGHRSLEVQVFCFGAFPKLKDVMASRRNRRMSLCQNF